MMESATWVVDSNRSLGARVVRTVTSSVKE